MIPVICERCHTRILVPVTVQGSEGICFKCHHPIRVPRPSEYIDVLRDFAPGELVGGRYRIAKALGRGGMGVVYGAVDTLVDEPVALKFMRPDRLSKPKARAMFIREAQVARRLRHDHITAVHDVGMTPEEVLYLSMELLEGQSLRSYLRAQRSARSHIRIQTVISFMIQILTALDYAHRTVFHRDMKPENIIVLPGDQLKVLDFGLAKAIDPDVEPDDGPIDPSKPRSLAGTAAYAAPEQKLYQELDHRVDLYAVGQIFRELLTLRTPFEEPAGIAGIRNDAAPGLLRVYEKATEEKREHRYATAAQFREALEDAYADAYGAPLPMNEILSGRGEVETDGMIHFSGGTFIMGNDAERIEAPAHETYVAPFYMDMCPVTNEAYNSFCDASDHPRSKFDKDPRYNGLAQPVVGVTYDDAMAYAAWVGKQLPTEAQWEFAARGTTQRKYPWGSAEPDSVLANFGEHVGCPSIVSLHDDGATPEGLLDMAGNVYEWTRDPFVPYGAMRTNPEGAQKEPRRTCRGGAWDSSADALRASHRMGQFPKSALATIGFRCVYELNDDVERA